MVQPPPMIGFTGFLLEEPKVIIQPKITQTIDPKVPLLFSVLLFFIAL